MKNVSKKCKNLNIVFDLCLNGLSITKNKKEELYNANFSGTER